MFKGKMFQQARCALDGDSNSMWNTMANTIRRVLKELLGESKGKGSISKETWWWNDEVQTILKQRGML
ncbi:hypothetical protein RHMOL_Rhmol01G0190600 [Rhododendron molle]|uniref:Uncharacterized protein n=1 Tax=Rhododendron molle TaxID=49168 RepID=A0ACC0Q4Q0_RHOML|nr:hypothetical protein RHMOL_Rhmol01G0190600 [Rhododendron molle]